MKSVGYTNMIYKIKDFLTDRNLLSPGERIAAAVSGGPDSVAMLICLNELKNSIGFNLSVIHINHMLRGEESDRDEKLVENIAKDLDISFYFARADVAGYKKKHKCSTQVAAREMRYFYFNQLAKKHSITKIATGHTADDQAETSLMKVIKGSGLKGISGISPVRDKKYIRPMLEIKKEEIELFLKEKKIKFAIDSTNIKNNYLRNQVRNRLIPYLKKEFNPSIVETLCRSSQIFRSEDDYLSKAAQKKFNQLLFKKNSGSLTLNASGFQSIHIALQRRIILIAIYHFPNEGKHVKADIVGNILKVIASDISGKSLDISRKLQFKYQYNQIVFRVSKNKSIPELIEPIKLIVPGKTKIAQLEKEIISSVAEKKDIQEDYKTMEPLKAFIDYDCSGKELFARIRRHGDRFHPLGSKGRKKLKDYFIDKKIPVEERDRTPIITNKESILWVAGCQISESVKIKEDTQNILILELC